MSRAAAPSKQDMTQPAPDALEPLGGWRVDVHACAQHVPRLFFFQAEDGIRDIGVTGVQTCALPILRKSSVASSGLTVAEQPMRWGRAPGSGASTRAWSRSSERADRKSVV